MKVYGPYLDKSKTRARDHARWYLVVFQPKLRPDGAFAIDDNGDVVEIRTRPYFTSEALADAEKARLLHQTDAAGTGERILTKQELLDYEAAKKVVGTTSLVEIAKFWRKHHPEKAPKTIEQLYREFINELRRQDGAAGPEFEVDGDGLLKPAGDSRHISDLRSRLGAFVRAGFGSRYPDSITRDEIITYILALPWDNRTKRNHKNALSAYFAWLLEDRHTTSNPAANIKRKRIGAEKPNDIRFLKVEETEAYLRAAERYDPELVAHEVVQLLAGVRSDDEMGDFDAAFVLPQTTEVVIPAHIAKTEKREVINTLEPSFWEWWKVYGKKEGLLRPRNYEPRWSRIRALAAVTDRAEADRLAALPLKTLLKTEIAKKAIAVWPWNARRRTFCTHHIAKYQSADSTALILRHQGDVSTLHNSYRGRGVTQPQGKQYFKLKPRPITTPIRPVHVPRGIVKLQAEARAANAVSKPTIDK